MFQDGGDIKMINKYFEACDLPKYNTTYLKNDLRKSKGIIAGKTIGTYKPNRELIEKLFLMIELFLKYYMKKQGGILNVFVNK